MEEKTTISNEIINAAKAYLKCFRPGAPVEEVLCRFDRHNDLLKAILKFGEYKYDPAELADIKQSVSRVTDNLDREIGLPLDSVSEFDAKLPEMSEKLLQLLRKNIAQWDGWQLDPDQDDVLIPVNHAIVNHWCTLGWKDADRLARIPATVVIKVAMDFLSRSYEVCHNCENHSRPRQLTCDPDDDPLSLVRSVLQVCAITVIRSAGVASNADCRKVLTAAMDLVGDCVKRKISHEALVHICNVMEFDIEKTIKLMAEFGYHR